MDLIDFTIQTLYHFGNFLATWATIATGVGIIIAIITLKNSNNDKRKELISKVYSKFLEDPEMYQFYEEIKKLKDGNINIENEKDKKLLNKSLSIFDEVFYLYTENLLNKNAWEYLSSEIQYFAMNDKVFDYIEMRFQQSKKDGLPYDIMPFTGFLDLLDLKKIPKECRVTNFTEICIKYDNLKKNMMK